MVKDIASAGVAGVIESAVSNRAEAQRFLGMERFGALEARLRWSPVARALGPGFVPNVTRNSVMAHSAFVSQFRVLGLSHTLTKTVTVPPTMVNLTLT